MAEQVGMMRADITKVRQIMFNLLSNACKFTENGSIHVEVERRSEHGQDWIRFKVADTGIGIDAKQKENLFKEFAQADTSISRKYGGTGLGLAISYRFVQLMKGRIAVQTEPGQGATFVVDLPAQVRTESPDSTQAEETSEASSRVPTVKTDQATILVIDDDAAVRDLMSRSLTKLDFNVLAAGDGEEGLRLARQVHPAIITLDVVMPDRDGWSVLHQLKADPELAEIPVIMVTIVDNQAMGLELGASNYLVKPVDRERLAALIEKHRPGHWSAPKTIKVPVSLSAERQDEGSIGAGSVRRR
jgi:CheY-like chemotaxis protein/anti-sigma regulatory factor (Ser/Thr protein kinase)